MSTANAKQSQTHHILVVDDEVQVSKFITEMLKTKGYAVTTLNNSQQALEYFQANADNIDLVITDQTMPDLTGAELSQAMLTTKPELPIFLVTGYSEEINSESASALGIKEFITKPLKLADLILKLTNHLPVT